MMKTLTRLPTVFALLLLALTTTEGCAGRAGTASQPAAEERITVRVQNLSFSQVAVYAMRSTQRIRLGDVGAQSTTVLTVPRSAVDASGTVRFLADPVGGARPAMSFDISVRPGDEVQMTIPGSAF